MHSSTLQSRQEQRKQLKMAEAVQHVMSIHISESDVVVPTVELKETLEQKVTILAIICREIVDDRTYYAVSTVDDIDLTLFPGSNESAGEDQR